MAHVRAKPVMREMMVQMLISAAEEPMDAAEACPEEPGALRAASEEACEASAVPVAADMPPFAVRVCRARESLSDMGSCLQSRCV